jgi:hypothetical protein
VWKVVNGIVVVLKMKELKSVVKVLLTAGFRYDDKIREGDCLGRWFYTLLTFSLRDF